MSKKEKPNKEWAIMLKELDEIAEAHKEKERQTKKPDEIGRMDSI